MPIPDDLMDRLKAAIIPTDATSADGTPAIRVQYVAATSPTITSKALADDLMDRLKASIIATDDTNADGAPAMRGRAV